MIFQESETTELNVQDSLKKEIIAFANCQGGKLYIGVDDDGSIVGLDSPDEVSLQISNMVRDTIKPDLTMFIHYETQTIDKKQILVVEVQRGSERPYYITKRGLRPEGVYVRQGYSSVPASATSIRKMIKETDGDHFETMRSLNQDLTFVAAKQEFSEKQLKFGIPQMKTLGVLNSDGIYTNLGLLLSDQCIHTIKVAIFSSDNENQFQDRKEFGGSLFKQMNDVYEYINIHNQLHSSFEKLNRIDQRDYPEIAIREALLNLLIHREYASHASSFIRIYQNKMEFTSLGGLVNGVTLDDIKMGISICRNEKLANIFYRLNLIEAYGTGLPKIMQTYSNTGLEPSVETSENAFKIILPNVNTHRLRHSTNDNLEDQIIRLAKKNGTIRRRDVENAFHMKQTTSGKIIKKMILQRILIKEGSGKNTFYHLADK